MRTIFHPPLYKIDTTGKIRCYKIEQQGNKYRMITGVKDSPKQVISTWTVCKGKNIGRANETTPKDQATFEIKARYTKKQEQESYHSSLKNVNKKSKFVKPMLAKVFEDCEDKVKLPGFVQPKLNGCRCVARNSGLKTRKGKDWVSTPHIMDDLKDLFSAIPEAILDGELYCDTFAHDLGSTVSLIKQKKPTAKDIAASAKVVIFNVFDLISDGTPGFDKKPFSDRILRAEQLLNKYCKNKRIRLVPATKVKSTKEIHQRMVEYLAENYEGLMFRNDAPYQYKRTADLLKLKTFQDAEFEILDVFEGNGNRSGMCGAFLLGDKKGRAFKSTPTGNREYFREILKNANDYKGRFATVEFIEYTVPQAKKDWKEYLDYKNRKWNLHTGEVPYHGVVVAVREDI